MTLSLSSLYHTFVREPYTEAVYQFQYMQTAPSCLQKITHLALGILLLVPLINVGIKQGLTCFRAYLIQGSNSLPDMQFLILSENHAGDHDEIERLVQKKQMKEAWQVYVATCEKEQAFSDNTLAWKRLPPEELVFYMLRNKAFLAKSQLHIPVEFIRDSAVKYKAFAMELLTEPEVWQKLEVWPEHFVDIAQAHPGFAFSLVTSSLGETIKNDTYLIEIFDAAYNTLINKATDNLLSLEQVQCLANYLLRYQLVISQERFNRIQELIASIEINQTEHKELLGLVLVKMALEGVYKSGKKLFVSFEKEALVSLLKVSSQDHSENEIIDKVIELDEEEDFDKGMRYLNRVPVGSPNYMYAQMALANLWLEQCCYREAGLCFLKAALLSKKSNLESKEQTRTREDAWKMAKINLVVKENEDYRIRKEGDRQECSPTTGQIKDEAFKELIQEQEFDFLDSKNEL